MVHNRTTTLRPVIAAGKVSHYSRTTLHTDVYSSVPRTSPKGVGRSASDLMKYGWLLPKAAR